MSAGGCFCSVLITAFIAVSVLSRRGLTLYLAEYKQKLTVFACMFFIAGNNTLFEFMYIHCEFMVIYTVGHKEHATLLLSISLPVIDRFLKFFH